MELLLVAPAAVLVCDACAAAKRAELSAELETTPGRACCCRLDDLILNRADCCACVWPPGRPEARLAMVGRAVAGEDWPPAAAATAATTWAGGGGGRGGPPAALAATCAWVMNEVVVVVVSPTEVVAVAGPHAPAAAPLGPPVSTLDDGFCFSGCKLSPRAALAGPEVALTR